MLYQTLVPWHAADAYFGSHQRFGTYSAAGTVDSSTEVETASSAFRTAAVKRSVLPTLVLALRTDPAAMVLLHSAFYDGLGKFDVTPKEALFAAVAVLCLTLCRRSHVYIAS